MNMRWEKEGYKIDVNENYQIIDDLLGKVWDAIEVITYAPDGERIGHAELRIFEDPKRLGAWSVWVKQEHQRKGIATAMYVAAEEETGRTIIRDEQQSGDAARFWNQPNRKFGQTK